MSVAKVRASSTSDAMKFERHSSFDNFITQAAGKEPTYVSFNRANEAAVTPWYQLLTHFESPVNKISKGQKVETGAMNASEENFNTINSLSESLSPGRIGGASTKLTKSSGESSLKIPDAVVAFAQAAAKANSENEKYLSGWPLLSSNKVQLQKCAKCSREFCSSVNYKRHIRTHRKSNIYEKVSPKTRDFLAAFWDKISEDEAKELVSFKDINLDLEGVAATTIIAELSSWAINPLFAYLPQVYSNAGKTLLHIVRAEPSRFPIRSQELFNVLDDASEKTFLCAGTASSLQKFLFDGDVAKIALDFKNIVACASLLLEQKLVKAWHADKDAEALRCQKLLVEEEEAAQKRQAELVERRRRKKLRQKGQKAKESGNDNLGIKDSQEVGDSTFFVESLTPILGSDVELDSEASSASSQPIPATTTSTMLDLKVEIDEGQVDSPSDHSDYLTAQVNDQWEVRTTPNQSSNNFYSGSVVGAKCMLTEKNYVIKNSKNMLSNGGQKVWTRKIKHENQEMSGYIPLPNDNVGADCLKPTEKPAVLIGTISVSLGDSVCSNMGPQLGLPVKSDSNINHTGRSVVKLWRPVSREGQKDSSGCQSSRAEADEMCNGTASSFESTGYCSEATNSSMFDNSCLSDGGDDVSSGRTYSSMPESTEPSAPQPFSSQIAEAFLKQRWEEAIAMDHVKLVLASDAEYVDCPSTLDGANCMEADGWTPQHGNCNVVSSSVQLACDACSESMKLKPRPEKVYRVEYVPKQRNYEIER